jgi:hypothetical protein
MGKPTQKDLILKYIHDFGSITSWEAYSELGITQVGARIFELKRMGYLFKKETVKKENRWGKLIPFDKYMLVGNIHKAANA